MFARSKEDANSAPLSSEPTSQTLAELAPDDGATVALGVASDDEFYDDSPDDLEPVPSAQHGGTGWLRTFGVVFAAFACFTFGAVAAKNSTKPLPLGPIAGSTDTNAGNLVVHVAGHVKSPGVYSLPYQARITDAIAKAGGPLPDADLNAINLASWAQDGSRIEVPAKSAAPRVVEAPAPVIEPVPEVAALAPAVGEVPVAPIAAAPKPLARVKPATAPRPTAVSKEKNDEVPRATTASGAESMNASPEFLEKNPIDLNTATAEQLQMLPGVGPAMAAKILKQRQEKGRFNAVDELDDVAGIGPKTLDKLRPLVTVK